MKHINSSLKTTASLLAALASLSVSYGHTVGFSGSIVGHDTADLGNPEQIANQNGTVINHPYHHTFVNIYGGLTGADSFDFNTGQDLALGHNPINNVNYPDDPHAPTGVGYWASLIDVNHGLSNLWGVAEGSQVGIAFRGFSLNINSATDHFYDTTTHVETRIYRNGEAGIYDLSDFSLLSSQTGLTATVYIDYNGGDIGITPFDTDTEAGDIDNSVDGWSEMITSFYSDGNQPIQVDGGTDLGNYAIFGGSGEINAVPEYSHFGLLVSACAALVCLRRRV